MCVWWGVVGWEGWGGWGGARACGAAALGRAWSHLLVWVVRPSPTPRALVDRRSPTNACPGNLVTGMSLCFCSAPPETCDTATTLCCAALVASPEHSTLPRSTPALLPARAMVQARWEEG